MKKKKKRELIRSSESRFHSRVVFPSASVHSPAIICFGSLSVSAHLLLHLLRCNVGRMWIAACFQLVVTAVRLWRKGSSCCEERTKLASVVPQGLRKGRLRGRSLADSAGVLSQRMQRDRGPGGKPSVS